MFVYKGVSGSVMPIWLSRYLHYVLSCEGSFPVWAERLKLFPHLKEFSTLIPTIQLFKLKRINNTSQQGLQTKYELYYWYFNFSVSSFYASNDLSRIELQKT